MHIVCNGSSVELPESTTVTLFLQQQGLSPLGMALAISDELIPRSQWPSKVLQEGDRLTLIRAAQGG